MSHVYETLSSFEERQAPRLVRAVLSYILTITSRPYLRSLSFSTGLKGLEETLAEARRKHARLTNDGMPQELSPDESVDQEESEDVLQRMDFPSFVPPDIRQDVLACQRSIRILASPELEDGEPIVGLSEFRTLEWVWTDSEVTSRALGQASNIHEDEWEAGEGDNHLEIARRRAAQHSYKPELASIAVYDLEPTGSVALCKHIVNFISSFPEYPPTLASTLPLLAKHALSPISSQASALGRAALRRFLTPGTHLYFRAHFILLRAYLLLSAPAFKTRLAVALFSDAEMDEEEDAGALENPMGMTIRTRGRNANWKAVQKKEHGKPVKKDMPWAVGLAFGLTDRAQWPPGGSDLSFYLRRVIMDSLEDVRDAESGLETNERRDEIGDDEFWDGAEARLGFAIRDLPAGTGREKWLDPTRECQAIVHPYYI